MYSIYTNFRYFLLILDNKDVDSLVCHHTTTETDQVLRLKNPTTYHVLQSQKRRQGLLTSKTATAAASSDGSYDQNARGDVGHKHLHYPRKTTTNSSVFMPRSAPEILPGDGMSPSSSGLVAVTAVSFTFTCASDSFFVKCA